MTPRKTPKTKRAILIPFAFVVLAAGAQTVTTNWVQAAVNFRVVNGRLYNTDKSTNWLQLTGRCAGIETNGVIVVTMAMPRIESDEMTRQGNFLGTRFIESAPHLPWDTKILVKNYPSNAVASAGGHVEQGKVMFVGVGPISTGERVKVYDWGIPHRVAVIRTNAAVK